MRLLLVVAHFPPEIASAAHVYYDLAKAFVKRGHRVDVLTSYPREFNLSKEDQGRRFPLEETLDGIVVHRCVHPAQRDNVVLRGLEHFILPRYYFKKYKELGKKFDGCLMYIPPLPLYYLARKIKRFDGTKSVLNFQDFHPQELTDVGVLRNPLMIKIMEHVERQAYKNADFITVLSEKGVDYVIQRGGSPDKISHIYNGVLLDTFDEKGQQKDFKEKQGIKDKTLVTYAGILSPYQGIDTILDVAKQLKNNDSVVFYIVGDGSEKTHLKQRITEENISNVTLLPFQRREEYFNIIHSSDIAFVTLDERMKAPCLPGKIKDLLALQKPIIASVGKETETADFILKSNCGVIVEPGDTQCISLELSRLVNNNESMKQMGVDGKKFLEQHMNLEKNVEKYEEIFGVLR
jgi:colanic acid biosynthesis glycosyl transferase WcaI